MGNCPILSVCILQRRGKAKRGNSFRRDSLSESNELMIVYVDKAKRAQKVLVAFP
jgi:hypothetical protein